MAGRGQKTDKEEFHITLNLKDPKLDLKKKLVESQDFYNNKRPHSSLNRKTPCENYLKPQEMTPVQVDIIENYWKKQK